MDPHAFLTQALAEWERCRSEGRPVSPEELCKHRPELLEEARRRIRSLEVLEQHARSTFRTEPSGPALAEQTLPGSDLPPDPGVELYNRYRNLEHLASGGLGDVFQAKDAELGRVVAIKFLKAIHQDDPFTRSQFLLEAEVTGQLDHPGVVPVFGFGLRSGQPFYVMRFLSGGTLNDGIAEFHATRRYSITKLKELVGHLRSACETLAYAHNRGVVHCDIKPGNILMGRFGETLVADWGSALVVSRDAQARASGEQTLRPTRADLGTTTSSSSTRPFTPAYMSPEQVPGSAASITPASDIYSLGATLYHLLTGRHQLAELYEGKKPTKDEIFAYLEEATPPRPRQVNPRVPPALEAICLKAMARRPDERYASALDLAHDLEAWRTDTHVSVYRESAIDRMLKGSRRHPQLAAALMLSGLLAFLLTLAALAYFRMRADSESQQRAMAEEARQKVEAARVGVLKGSAQWAAEMLASEIDFRWRVLEALADDANVKQALAELAGKPLPISNQPPHPGLQQWLEDQRQIYKNLSTSWLIVDGEGRLVGRVPPPTSEKTFGLSFRYRDYFHGQGLDDDPRQASTRPAIRAPYRSSVYRSVSTGELLMTFTVPVFAEKANVGKREKLLGVLGMSVEVSKFDSLRSREGSPLAYSLVDFRPNEIDGQKYEGMYVHHHAFADQRRKGQKPPTLPGPLVASLREKMGIALAGPAEGSGADLEPAPDRRAGTDAEPWFDPDFDDPLAAAGGAAFAPVVVRARSEPAQRYPRLLVIVQEGKP